MWESVFTYFLIFSSIDMPMFKEAPYVTFHILNMPKRHIYFIILILCSIIGSHSSWAQNKKKKKYLTHELNEEHVLKLGQLYEIVGDTASAVEVYELVLKHHRKDVKEIQIHYEELANELVSDYVPLKYYYELIDYKKSIDTLRPPRSW